MNIELCKTLFVASALSLMATACAATSTDNGSDEDVGSTASGLSVADQPCDGCDPGGGGGGEPTPPPPRPPPATQPQPQGDDTCVKPNCKNYEGIKAVSGSTLDNPDFRCEGITQPECQNERQFALDVQMATAKGMDYTRIRDAYPLFGSGFIVRGVCRCGCFEAETEILTAEGDGTVAWKAANTIEGKDKLMSLTETASLTRPELEAKSITSRTQGAEKPALYVFVLDNGHKLKVTQYHGMVLDDGRVVAAKDVPEGARFVGLRGSTVRVLAVEREQTQDVVYNFEVPAERNQGHVLVAEGVLVGDLAWQNRLKSELGAIQIRK